MSSSESHGSRDFDALMQSLSRPAIHIIKTGGPSNSYFGGAPPDYDGFLWPTTAGRPLGFIACLDLSQIPRCADMEWLPAAGRLLFFYDLEEQPWGVDPKDHHGWRVIYVPHAISLRGKVHPPNELGANSRLPCSYVAFQTIRLPPPWNHPDVNSLQFDEDENEAYANFRSSLFGKEPHHQFTGYPDVIQGAEMELECQLASNGLYCGNASGFEDPRAEVLAKGASDWRLLLQFDSDDELDIMFGDGGMLYFWIRQQDAQNEDFDGCWLVLQCY